MLWEYKRKPETNRRKTFFGRLPPHKKETPFVCKVARIRANDSKWHPSIFESTKTRRAMSSECSGQCHRLKGLCKKVHPPGQHFGCGNQEVFGESGSSQCHVWMFVFLQCCKKLSLGRCSQGCIPCRFSSQNVCAKYLQKRPKFHLFKWILLFMFHITDPFATPPLEGPAATEGSYMRQRFCENPWEVSCQNKVVQLWELLKILGKQFPHQNIHESMSGESLRLPPQKKRYVWPLAWPPKPEPPHFSKVLGDCHESISCKNSMYRYVFAITPLHWWTKDLSETVPVHSHHSISRSFISSTNLHHVGVLFYSYAHRDDKSKNCSRDPRHITSSTRTSRGRKFPVYKKNINL